MAPTFKLVRLDIATPQFVNIVTEKSRMDAGAYSPVQVNPPTISISSIGGYAAPSATGETWKTVDLLLPTQLQDPITVVVQGTNVPVGSQVTLTFSGSAETAVPATAT